MSKIMKKTYSRNQYYLNRFRLIKQSEIDREKFIQRIKDNLCEEMQRNIDNEMLKMIYSMKPIVVTKDPIKHKEKLRAIYLCEMS